MRSRPSWMVVAAVILSFAAAGPGVAPAHATPSGFVGASGRDFVLDGRVWRPVGYNQYRLTSMPGGFVCDGGYGGISDASLGQRLDQMKAAGANVVRTWFFQRYWQEGPAGNQWAALDRVITAAASRGLKVIPVLVNQWPDCEWPSIAKNHGFYQSAYLSPGYGNVLSYKDWAVTVATRYASDPAVAFWQLVNEAEASYYDAGGNFQCPADAPNVLRSFADDMVGRIKAVDPNHLVSLGTIGSGQCGASSDQYSYVHAGAVDMCEIHDYDEPPVALPGDQYNGVAVRLNQCNALNKPIFAGEAGIRADVAADGGDTGSITAATLARRAQFFDNKIAGQFAKGLDGWLIWDKIVEASDSTFNRDSGEFGVGPGDPTEGVMRVWGGVTAETVTGFTWYGDGSFQRSGSPGTVVSAFATGLTPNKGYRLVVGQGGDAGEACRYNAVPLNAAIRLSNSRGFVPMTAGAIDRPAGTWQVCFRAVDGTRAGLPTTFVVT